MKTLLLATISTFAMASAALAADPIAPMDEALAPVAAETDWSGFYAGIFVGGGSFTGLIENNDGSAIDDDPFSIETEGGSALAGLQVGVDGQAGSLVYGIVGSATWTNFNEAYGYDSGDNYTSAAISGIFALQGKLGFSAGKALFYGTAGIAGVLADQCATDDDDLGSNPVDRSCDEATYDGVQSDEIQVGAIGGVGAEFMVTDMLGLFVEYNYFATNPINQDYFVDTGNADFSTSGHLVKVGVNSHF